MPGVNAQRPGSLPLVLATPLSWMYRAGMEAHQAVRRRAHTRLPIPVISIGNLSVGGTGKTPLVLHAAQSLVAAGHRPCIAMRGYAASAEGGSDEASVYHRAFARLGLDVPIVARPDRAAGVAALLARRPEIDAVLLDDGFQHRRLARDLDLVLVDATRPPFEDRLLPAGWLREPVSALRRAGGVVLTHAESVPAVTIEDLARRIETAHGRPPIAVTRHVWESLDVLDVSASPPTTDAQSEHPVGWLAGKRVLLTCAIGNPGPFEQAAARAIGAAPASTIILRDHDPYSAPTVDRILAEARGMDAILTTDKDWSKLAEVDPARWPCPVVRPRLGLAFDAGEAALDAMLLAAARRPPEPTR